MIKMRPRTIVGACVTVVTVVLVSTAVSVANFSPIKPAEGESCQSALDEPTEAKVFEFTPDEVAEFFAKEDKKVLTFMGFSGAGYEDEEKVLRQAREILESQSPEQTIVNIGATKEGIGKVYELAKALGFKTTGIVSTQAKKYNAELSEHLDVAIYVQDETWGGFQEGTETLSPTSQAMVQSSDTIVSFGGGEVTRDELIAAKRMNKPVRFVAADMNHAVAIEKAKKKNLPVPTDFRGAAYEVFGR